MHYTLAILHSTARITAFIFLLVLSSESGLAQEKPTAAPEAPQKQVQSGEYIGPLELGKAIERELKGGAIHLYDLNLVAGQFVHVIVEQRGIDVVVRLFAPEGKKIAEIDSPNGTQGAEAVFALAEVAGSYRLEIESLNKFAAAGSYGVSIAALRPADSADRALLATQARLQEVSRIDAQVENLFGNGKYAEAIPLAERALSIREQVLGFEHPDVAGTLGTLAVLYGTMGDYVRAEPLFQRALAINEKLLGADHPAVAESLYNLGRLYVEKGDYTRAEPLYERALAIRERAVGPQHPDVASSLDQLAGLYRRQNDYVRAEPLFERALEINQKAFGPDHLEVANSLNNLAILYQEKGNYARAELLFARAVEISEKSLGSNHPTVASAVSNLAALFYYKGDYSRAEPLYERALKIYEKELGSEHPSVALILNNLAAIYKRRGDYSRAEPMFRQALAIYEKALGPGHPDVAATLVNIASLNQQKGDYVLAESLYRRALTIRETRLGSENPAVAVTLNALAELSLVKGDVSEAVRLLIRASEISEHYLGLVLMTGSEEQKRLFMQTLSSESDSILSLPINAAPGDAQVIDLGLTTVLRRKGRVLDAMSDSFGGLRRSLSAEDRHVLDQLSSAYSQYAALANQGLGSAAPAERRAAAAEMISTIEQLEARASKSGAAFRTENRAVTLFDVQNALPEGTALLEIVLLRPLKLKAKTEVDRYGRARYVACALRGDGPPTWVDLGEAEVIDRDVAELRRALNDPRLPVKRLAHALDEKLMRPVRRLLGDTRRVFLSPDGALNLLPFGALVDERGKYLIENYSFTYLTSGRDLLRLKTSEGGESTSILVADPAFDVAVTTANASAPSRDIAQKRRSTDLKDARLAPLPGTREEAERIKALLPEARVLLGTEATEAGTKQVSHPRILHIATHGFFLGDESHTPNFENPLLRSGLFLAGASKRQSGPGEDGVLTALEVSGLDLWGTKLVVLSACETGLGDVKNGEGVYGLRRALVLAGSETQVMSLWKVSDSGTRDLMVAYYTLLQRGEGRAEALRQVQLAMLRGKLSRPAGSGKRETTDPGEQPASKDYRHPYYWAAFIQSGDWRNMDGK